MNFSPRNQVIINMGDFVREYNSRTLSSNVNVKVEIKNVLVLVAHLFYSALQEVINVQGFRNFNNGIENHFYQQPALVCFHLMVG